MKLSTYADYSCRVLMFLAAKGEQSSIDEIASSFHISKNHLVKVVHALGQLGYINTVRGRGGGISLARPPEEIIIGDVIRKTESNLNVVECFNVATNSCPIISSCGLKPWLNEALAAFLATLDKVNLADITLKRKGLRTALNI